MDQSKPLPRRKRAKDTLLGGEDMSKSGGVQFTPGPWVVHTFTISGKEKLEVLDATGTNACVQANAHLIAAAPAMYEALGELIAYLRNNVADEALDNWAPVLKAAYALAQAEGSKP